MENRERMVSIAERCAVCAVPNDIESATHDGAMMRAVATTIAEMVDAGLLTVPRAIGCASHTHGHFAVFACDVYDVLVFDTGDAPPVQYGVNTYAEIGAGIVDAIQLTIEL